jgi:hypothetical protein
MRNVRIVQGGFVIALALGVAGCSVPDAVPKKVGHPKSANHEATTSTTSTNPLTASPPVSASIPTTTPITYYVPPATTHVGKAGLPAVHAPRVPHVHLHLHTVGKRCPLAWHGLTVQGVSGPVVCASTPTGWRFEPPTYASVTTTTTAAPVPTATTPSSTTTPTVAPTTPESTATPSS